MPGTRQSSGERLRSRLLDVVWIRLLYVLFTAGLVIAHMEYVHRPAVRYTKTFTWIQLSCDLVGFTTTWLMLTHLRPDDHWINWFLGVHGVVHLASLGWALFHWPSLEEHMRLFQARKLHPIFQASEFLYEQSDTALYITTVAIVASTLPIWAVVVASMTVSTLVAAFRPTAGFARAARRDPPEPVRSAA